MAPFPESESMTIKRLEVALRKKDMQLLKDGAYKLHEKFHTGHRFEFTQELSNILGYIKTSDIPLEITEILCPTIEEILGIISSVPDTDFGQQKTDYTEPVATLNPENTVYGTNVSEPEIKLQGEAWEEYKIEQEARRELEEIPFSEEYEQNVTTDIGGTYEPVSLNKEAQPVQMTIQTETAKTLPEPADELEIEEKEEILPAKEIPTDEVVLFYDDKINQIDYSQIKDYRNKLNVLFSSDNQEGDFNLLREIASINNIVDVKIFDLDKILTVLAGAKSHVSFITTSQSQEITKLFIQKEINFDIPFVKGISFDNSVKLPITFIPMLGLSNIFVCSNCNLRSLKSDFSAKTLSVQCPNCDSAAFPDLYAVNSYNPDCNPIFWHRALRAFVKSKIWVIVNPPLDENKEIIFDFIKTAADCSSPKRIYLLSKENDKREFYKQMFSKLLPNAEVRSNYINEDALCEDYIKTQLSTNLRL